MIMRRAPWLIRFQMVAWCSLQLCPPSRYAEKVAAAQAAERMYRVTALADELQVKGTQVPLGPGQTAVSEPSGTRNGSACLKKRRR
jgi:hypothetical protein